MRKTTVMIVDDHPIFREGLKTTISSSGAFELWGEAASAEEALGMIGDDPPDIAVVDIGLIGMSGLELVKKASAAAPETSFIILTMYDDMEYFEAAVGLGVKGYVLKDDASEYLLDCLKAVISGRNYISPSISWRLVGAGEREQPPSRQGGGDNAAPAVTDLFSPMERQVLKLVAEFKTSREIADALCISPRTVQNHRANISEKLGLKGPGKLLRYAVERKDRL